jgi:DNA repair exonuclease SbcCD ATPase subunit
MPKRIYDAFSLVKKEERNIGGSARLVSVFSCPHCETKLDVPDIHVSKVKGSVCKAHLAVCPNYTPPPSTEVALPVSNCGSTLDLATELRKMREEREAAEAKLETEREASKRRHEELMEQLTERNDQLEGMRSQLTDVQTQLTDKRRCLTDVREWGNLKEPDNTLVPQLSLRERELLAPREQRIALLQQQVNEKTKGASETAIKRAVEAELRLKSSEEELRACRQELEESRQWSKRQRQQDDLKYAALVEQYKELASRKQRAVHALPEALLKESPHARRHGMVAFHPDRQPTAKARRLAQPLFQQISAAQGARSAGTED